MTQALRLHGTLQLSVIVAAHWKFQRIPLAAFRYSRDLGLKWLELDVRMAADGVVVCHDAFLGRLGKRPDIEVWKTPITALKEISVGDPMPSEYALGKLEEFGPRFLALATPMPLKRFQLSLKHFKRLRIFTSWSN